MLCTWFPERPLVAAISTGRCTTFSKALLERRITAIKLALPLTEDEAIILPYRLQATTLVAQLEVALASIRIYDDEIAALAPQHPDYSLFDRLPGAGASLAPRLLVAFGEQRERYSKAAELQKYAGIAPVTERSGQSTWIHWRWQCPTVLRQTFVEWSAQTINKSYWAGLYYYQQRGKGCSHQAAVRALAFKCQHPQGRASGRCRQPPWPP